MEARGNSAGVLIIVSLASSAISTAAGRVFDLRACSFEISGQLGDFS